MTVVQPNSIAGINSITVQSGNALNLHKSDGTLIRTLVAESGISTYSSIVVGSATTDNNANKSINIGLGASISQHADNTLSFGTNGIERARFDSSGRLLINKTSGSFGLEVGAGSDSTFRITNALESSHGSHDTKIVSGGSYYQNPNIVGSAIKFTTYNGSSEGERARITSAGDVGISTLTPASKLHLYDAASDGLIVQSPSGLHYVWAIQANGNLNNGSLAGELGIRGQSGVSISANNGTSTQLRLDSGGRLLVGATSDVSPDSFGSLLQIDSGSSAGSIALGRHTASGSGPALLFHKSRSGSGAGDTIVQDGDNLGTIRFFGADGTDRNSYGAQISANVDGTPGSNDMPGNLKFSTTADGAVTPTERLILDSTGRTLIGAGAIAAPKASVGGLDISSGLLSLVVGGEANTGDGTPRTNSVQKEARICVPHYTLAEEPTAALVVFNQASANRINIGGATGICNAATDIRFFTAANTTTVSGTERLKIDSSGHITPGADATQDLGSISLRWANIYSADLQLSNEGSQNEVDGSWGTYTIQEGESDLFLINRRNGKKYKFNLTEVS